jgi:hypothetical protein
MNYQPLQKWFICKRLISVSIYFAGVKERCVPYALNAQLLGETIKVGLWTGVGDLGLKETPGGKESQTVG